MPAELRRHFEVVFKPLAKSQPVPMRQIGSEHVGKLVSVQVQSSAIILPPGQVMVETVCSSAYSTSKPLLKSTCIISGRASETLRA